MLVKIDLNDLLQKLQAIDVAHADNDSLLEIISLVDLVEAAQKSMPPDILEKYQDLIFHISELSKPICAELTARGFLHISINQLIHEDPEIITEALLEMPTFQFFDLYEMLQTAVKDNAEYEPLYLIASEVLREICGSTTPS